MIKAAVLTPGPALHIQEVPLRAPGPGQVQIALRAAALNRRDVWIRLGKYAGIRTPCVLGSDGAGVIQAVGEGVDARRVGEEVVIDPSLSWGEGERLPGADFRILGMPEDGTFAEAVLVPAQNAVRKPPHLSWEEAAALPLAGLTAYRALRRGRLRAGETVLVPGIGSGVSTMVLMLARHLGAQVAVTSGSAEKLERARALGAAYAISHREPDWAARLVKEFGAPDLAVDGAGGETFAACVAAVRPGGRVVSYGATAGACQLEVRRLFWKQLDLLGSTMGSPRDFRELVALTAAGGLRPVIDQVFPLSEASRAFDRMERGEHIGKIVLKIG